MKLQYNIIPNAEISFFANSAYLCPTTSGSVCTSWARYINRSFDGFDHINLKFSKTQLKFFSQTAFIVQDPTTGSTISVVLFLIGLHASTFFIPIVIIRFCGVCHKVLHPHVAQSLCQSCVLCFAPFYCSIPLSLCISVFSVFSFSCKHQV